MTYDSYKGAESQHWLYLPQFYVNVPFWWLLIVKELGELVEKIRLTFQQRLHCGHEIGRVRMGGILPLSECLDHALQCVRLFTEVNLKHERTFARRWAIQKDTPNCY